MKHVSDPIPAFPLLPGHFSRLILLPLVAALAGPAALGGEPAPFEVQVLAPFRAQLAERTARGEAHARAIDEGRVHLVEGPGFGADEVNRHVRDHGFDFPPGWVMRVVRPFEGDYFTTQRSGYELTGWHWVAGREGSQAQVSYTETLWLKAEDSLDAIPKGQWRRWLTLTHDLVVRRDGASWSVEIMQAPPQTPGGSRRRDLYAVPTIPAP